MEELEKRNNGIFFAATLQKNYSRHVSVSSATLGSISLPHSVKSFSGRRLSSGAPVTRRLGSATRGNKFGAGKKKQKPESQY
jgi:hypothetical protein